jgi:hypothetical protein
MQARAAYIRSIGTTGILVAASLLMLATVGALVAYDGWPGGEGAAPVTSVPVQTPRSVSVVRRVTPAPPAATKLVARAAADSPPVAGLVRDVSARGQSTVGLVKLPPSPPGVVSPDAGTPAAPPADGAPPPVIEPAPPARPEVPLPEPISGPVQGTEELAYSLVGTALPQAEDQPADQTPVDEPALGIDLGNLVLALP